MQFSPYYPGAPILFEPIDPKKRAPSTSLCERRARRIGLPQKVHSIGKVCLGKFCPPLLCQVGLLASGVYDFTTKLRTYVLYSNDRGESPHDGANGFLDRERANA